MTDEGETTAAREWLGFLLGCVFAAAFIFCFAVAIESLVLTGITGEHWPRLAAWCLAGGFAFGISVFLITD